MDPFNNFAVSFVAVAPNPPDTGTTLSVLPGHGARFPAPPFNLTIWPKGTLPEPTNAEIVRVTALVGDQVTFLREQENTTAHAVLVGDRIAEAITAKTLTDLAGSVARSASVFPYRPDLSTTAENDPGAGMIRWNNADQLAATALYVDRLTADGFDAQLLISKLPAGSAIWIQDEDMAATYQEWALVSYESRVDWFVLHVTLRSVGGSGIIAPQAAPITNRVSLIIVAASGLHHVTHEPGGTDALVNAAWTNQANTFTAGQAITRTGFPALKLTSNVPMIEWTETGAPVDRKSWRLFITAEKLYVSAVSDDLATGFNYPLIIGRDGDLTVGRNLLAPGITNGNGLAAGVSTPTTTVVTNLSAVAATEAQHLRVGNTVTVSGFATITPVAPGAVAFDMSVPIPSALGSYFMAGGVFASNNQRTAGGIYAIAPNTVRVEGLAETAGAHSIGFQFTYRVL